jgi:hypothetical protein
MFSLLPEGKDARRADEGDQKSTKLAVNWGCVTQTQECSNAPVQRVISDIIREFTVA